MWTKLLAVVGLVLLARAFNIQALEPGQPANDDCLCNNQKAGRYCGSSPMIKPAKGRKCVAPDYIFQCIENGRDTEIYPEKITKCKDGFKCNQSSSTDVTCTTAGTAGTTSDDPGKADCALCLRQL